MRFDEFASMASFSRPALLSLAAGATHTTLCQPSTAIGGFEGMESEGPPHGTPVPSRLSIAATDFVAAGRIGVECTGVNPAWSESSQFCCDSGLAQDDPAKIDLRGFVTLPEVRMTCKLHPRVDKQIEWLGPDPKG